MDIPDLLKRLHSLVRQSEDTLRQIEMMQAATRAEYRALLDDKTAGSHDRAMELYSYAAGAGGARMRHEAETFRQAIAAIETLQEITA